MDRQKELRPPTEARACKSCGASVFWGKWRTSNKSMPVDVEATPDGSVVLSVRKGAAGEGFVFDKYDAEVHAQDRRRFTSHFASCPQAESHRRAR